MTLMTFLLCARQLLWKSRRILLGDASSLEVSPYLLTDTTAAMLLPLGLSGAAGVTSVGHLGANVQAMVVHHAAAAAATSVGGVGGGIGGISAGSRASMAMNGVGGNGTVGGAGAIGGVSSTAAQRRSVNDNVAVNAAALQAAGGAGGVGAGANGGNAANGGGGVNGGALNGVAGGDANYLIWQAEMEKGYESLVNSIFPYICDLREAASLAPKPRL